MSEPENMLSRWSRRKLASAREADAFPDPTSAKPSGVQTLPLSPEAPSGAAPNEQASAPDAFDTASLPPIDSIAANTDITLFLRAEVPAALKRSALRRAWTADPAIRDFIGIAENQWDFNDPTAMPGFGTLGVDEAARLAEQMFGRVETEIKRIAEASASPPRNRAAETPELEQRAESDGDDNERG